jgi:hypothetical protein
MERTGIDAKYDGIAQGLRAKFGSEARALTALQEFYRNLTGGMASTGQTSTSGLISDIMRIFTANGIDEATAQQIMTNRLSASYSPEEELGGMLGM